MTKGLSFNFNFNKHNVMIKKEMLIFIHKYTHLNMYNKD